MSKKTLLPDLFLRTWNRRNHARKLEMTKQGCIVESSYVTIGGIEQWITIRGEDRSNPVLLFLHGGPGSPYTVFTPLLREWEQDFTVVQWDQRGAGHTFRKNGVDGSGRITFDRLVQDGMEVTEYVLKRLGQRKLILIGSSAGSLTGAMMARQRPDLFYAYIGTDQNTPDPMHLGYESALKALQTAGLPKGVELVKKMGPAARKWTRKDFDRRNRILVNASPQVPHMIMDLMLPSMLSSPHHTLRDLSVIMKGMHFTLDYLFDEFMNFDYAGRIGTQFEVPFFLFQGDSDVITPTVTAKDFFDRVEAPHKEFVLIREAGHLACFARPGQFYEELMRRVRPWALEETFDTIDASR
ncbi:alpha/beta fold hydrolase [Paenibacillus gansuensis]|uniref:Alpha/beta fold hydrolase n=1 Tax=Paenibacillus gansuensis TaxID=306542 RepID=A0ABW5P8I8_9BACL